MIPYEPWNQDTLLSELLWETRHVYWTAFYAPSTGNYTHAQILPSSVNVVTNSAYTGKIGVGIYTDLDIAATTLTGSGSRPTRNIPDRILGEGYYDVPFPASTDLRNVYLNIPFRSPIPLVKNQLYWFALGVTNQLYFNFHADYLGLSCQVVETSAAPFTTTLPAAVGGPGALRASERATWFRHL